MGKIISTFSRLSRKRAKLAIQQVTSLPATHNSKPTTVVKSESPKPLQKRTSNKHDSVLLHIHWTSKFYKRKAEEFSECVKEAKQSQESRQQQLQWHFYANFLLALLEHGKDVHTIKDVLSETDIRHYLGDKFDEEQYQAASTNGSIMKTKVYSFIPRSKYSWMSYSVQEDHF
jgi:hypothetical protein